MQPSRSVPNPPDILTLPPIPQLPRQMSSHLIAAGIRLPAQPQERQFSPVVVMGSQFPTNSGQRPEGHSRRVELVSLLKFRQFGLQSFPVLAPRFIKIRIEAQASAPDGRLQGIPSVGDRSVRHRVQLEKFPDGLTFNDVFYSQKQGTAMGTCFAPSYTNLFMGDWEQQVSRSLDQYRGHVKLWLQYIDDLFNILEGTSEKAKEFISKLNMNESNLTFEGTISDQKIELLGLCVEVVDNKLVSKLYCKTTAGNTLLHAESGHPSTLIRSIPYGEFLRARRNCSTESDFNTECECMTRRFLERGYDSNVIKQTQVKAANFKQSELLWRREKWKIRSSDSFLLSIGFLAGTEVP
ncbi:uncharacterized protein LOC144763140 [Lissotriton helveticus]